jgi:hypothetical protein
MRYGSMISSMDSRSSLMEAEMVPTPTGPPSNFSMMVVKTFRSISSSPNLSTSISSSARRDTSRVTRPSYSTSA